jgi:hypothetical protein
MEANIMSADAGATDIVIGRRSAMAKAGPMPGNTPTKVPKNVPARPYIKLVAVKAVAKPSRSKFILFISMPPS